jgi:hypothetical protein
LSEEAPDPPKVDIAKLNFSVEGGDRVDADGIPLYSITHWQKAHFLDQMDTAHACITLPPIGIKSFRGEPNKGMVLDQAPRNAAFC